MILLERLNEFDAAANQFASEGLHAYDPTIDLSQTNTLVKLCGRCVLPARNDVGTTNPALMGDWDTAANKWQWKSVATEGELPVLWKHCALKFRELVAAAIPEDKPLPAYFALLLDFDEKLTKEGSTNIEKPGSFSFAAFDHAPTKAVEVIAGYIRDTGFSTSELLYQIEPQSRRPIIISWAQSEPFKIPNLKDAAYSFCFVGDTIQASDNDSSFEAPAIKRAIQKIFPNHKDPGVEAKARYQSTIAGYIRHVSHSLEEGTSCSRLIGLFLPTIITGESRSAVFFLFDASNLTDFSQFHFDPLFLLARSLTGTFNDWQQKLKSKIATEFCDSDWESNDALRTVIRHYQTLLASDATLASRSPSVGFWSHNHIDANWESYAQVIRELFQVTDQTGEWTKIKWKPVIKAIFMVDSIAEKPSCKRWAANSPNNWPDYNVSKDVLTAIFTNFVKIAIIEWELDAEVSERSVPLPMRPGFPFLLSLRFLIAALVEDGLVTEDRTRIVIEGNKRNMTLTVHFEANSDKNFGLGQAWIDKALGRRSKLQHGVCGAVLGVMSGWVPLKTPNDGKSYPDAILAMLRDGQTTPVCGVRFGPHFITFSW